jgi:hypothetical protein
LAVGASKVYLETSFHDLVIVNRQSGELIAGPAATRDRAGLDLREYSLSVANDINDRIYFCTPFGSIVAVREFGVITPTPLRDPADPIFGYISSDPLLDVRTPPTPDSPPFRENADDPAVQNPNDTPF